MKNYFTIFALLFIFTSTASATQCVPDGLAIWPRGGIIHSNSRIMVQSIGEERTGLVRKAMNDSVQFVLKSGKTVVELEFDEFHIGDHNTTQLFLIPKEKLKKGKIYTLFAEGATTAENKRLATFNPVWKATDEEIALPPLDNFNPIITLTANHGGRYGVGKQVIFKTDLFTNNLFLKVNLKVLNEPLPVRTFLYEATGGEMIISGQICYNGIVLQGEHQYIIDITPVDEAGNEGETKTMEFTL